MVRCKRGYEANPQVLIWGESELAHRVAVEMGRHLPIVWAFPGEPVGSPEGITVLGNSRLSKVVGTSGDFTVEIETDGDLTQRNVGTIMVFPEPRCDIVAEFKAAGEAERPLTLWLVLEKIRPGVFREIVKESLAVTSRGHQVFLVVDEVQVSFPDGEELYQEARHAGVIFLKDTVVSLPDKGTADGSSLPRDIEDQAGVSHGESGTQTVHVQTRTLGGTEPWVTEADRVWWHTGQAKTDYLKVLNLLGVELNRQEYYPFRTGCEGILVVDSGWGEPFSDEETIACLKMLVRPYDDEATRPTCNYEIQPDLCALCLTCYRTCPHQAVRLGQKAQNLYGQAMLIDPHACFNCGRCQAECPAQAIRRVFGQELAPGTLVLACENSGGPLLRNAGIPYRLFPCAGSIGVIDILEAWEPGIDRLVIMTCRNGKCQHGSGGERLSSRVERLNRLIKSLSVPVNIEVMRVSAQDRVDEIRRRVIEA